MNIDERLEKLGKTLERLAERHQAAAESLELLKQNLESMAEQNRERDARYDEMRFAVLRAIAAYLAPPEAN